MSILNEKSKKTKKGGSTIQVATNKLGINITTQCMKKNQQQSRQSPTSPISQSPKTSHTSPKTLTLSQSPTSSQSSRSSRSSTSSTSHTSPKSSHTSPKSLSNVHKNRLQELNKQEINIKDEIINIKDEIKNWDIIIDSILTEANNIESIQCENEHATGSPPKGPPNSPPKSNGSSCDFEINTNAQDKEGFIKNINCDKKYLDNLKNFINKVLENIVQELFRDVLNTTLTLNFEELFKSIIVSMIIDILFNEVCNDATIKIKNTICKEAKNLSNVALSMKWKNYNVKLEKVIRVFIITKTKQFCKLPTLKNFVKKTIIQHLNDINRSNGGINTRQNKTVGDKTL